MAPSLLLDMAWQCRKLEKTCTRSGLELFETHVAAYATVHCLCPLEGIPSIFGGALNKTLVRLDKRVQLMGAHVKLIEFRVERYFTWASHGLVLLTSCRGQF